MTTIARVAKNFFSNTSGNIAIIGALTLLPILIAAGTAVDYSRYQQLRDKAAQAADLALLAAASIAMKDGLINDSADEQVVLNSLDATFKKFFQANFNSAAGKTTPKYTIKYDSETKDVTVDLSFNYKTAFGGLITPNVKVAVLTSVNLSMEQGGAFSMYLVLDKSGSMNGRTKIGAL